MVFYLQPLEMTHRDRLGDPPGQAAGQGAGQGAGRRGTASGAGHRQGFPTHAAPWPGGSPRRQRDGEDRLERRIALRLAPDIADHAAQTDA